MITREKLLKDIAGAAYEAGTTVSQLFKKAKLSLTTLHRMRHGKDFYFSTYTTAMEKAKELREEKDKLLKSKSKGTPKKGNQDANKDDGS